MPNQNQSQVVGEGGLRGAILGPSDTSPEEIAIELDDGRQISVPPSALTLRPGGGWFLQNGVANGGTQEREIVIPVLSEELEVAKQKRTTGKVRVEKDSIPHDERISMPLTREMADVRRVVINKRVDGPLPVRREGDTIIMPVVEEVAVVEKQMILKEEIRITRRRTTEQHEETVTLHTEQANVQREDAAGNRKADGAARPAEVLPREERSILDPTKPLPTVLSPRRRTSARTRRSLLDD